MNRQEGAFGKERQVQEQEQGERLWASGHGARFGLRESASIEKDGGPAKVTGVSEMWTNKRQAKSREKSGLNKASANEGGDVERAGFQALRLSQ